MQEAPPIGGVIYLGRLEMTKFDLLVIDADIIAYRSSIAVEKRFIIATHALEVGCGRWDNRTQYKEWLSANGALDIYKEAVIEDKQELESSALSFMKFAIRNTIDKMQLRLNAKDVVCLLGGKGNFRECLLLPQKYKGNRDGTAKPLLLQSAREYIIENYNTEVVSGMEADDRLAMYQYKGHKDGSIVVSTLDKDARATAGWLYNHVNDELMRIPNGVGKLDLTDGKLTGIGRKWLYAQMVMGDTADGYKPSFLCKAKFGDTATYKLLNECKDDRECWQAIAKQYFTWYGELTHWADWTGKVHEGNWIDLLQVYADACHMLRWESDRLNVREALKRFNII